MRIRQKRGIPRNGDSFEVTFGRFGERCYTFKLGPDGYYRAEVNHRDDALRLIGIGSVYEIDPDSEVKDEEMKRKAIEAQAIAKAEARKKAEQEKREAEAMQDIMEQRASAKRKAEAEQIAKDMQVEDIPADPEPEKEAAQEAAKEPAPETPSKPFNIPHADIGAPAHAAEEQGKQRVQTKKNAKG